MSQEFNTSSKKPRRVTRAERNRPVLVTPGSSKLEEQPVEEMPVPDVEPITLVETPPVPKRRIAGFFSTVGKSDVETEEADVAKARLARATHGKPSAGKTAIKEAPEEVKKAVKPAARPVQPQKPKGLFKPRHIFGLLVYLVAANFLGTFENTILTNMGMNHSLGKFNLFGIPISLVPSGLAYIATLIIILVVLARMDFLPTSLNPGGRQAARKGIAPKNATSREANGDGPRPQPPVMRQGVQGADDELYRAYRSNQRREKKR